MAKLGSAHALREARRGNTWELIGRVLARKRLTSEEREFIADALERLNGKAGKHEVRRMGRILDRLYVEGIMAGQYGPPVKKQEAAVKRLIEWKEAWGEKGRRAHIMKALKEPLDISPPEKKSKKPT